MPSRDGDFLPPGGFKPIERGLPRSYLQEMLEGHQIAMLHFLDDVGPTGSRGLAFELTDGSRLIIWAMRDRYSRFSARLALRRLAPPRILTPEQIAGFSRGRGADPTAEAPDVLQRHIEGQLIRNCVHDKTPALRSGGERLILEFSDGSNLILTAVPFEQMRSGKSLLADIQWEYAKPEQTRILLP